MAGSTYTYRITAEGVDAVKAAFGDLQSKLLEFAGIGGLGFMIDNSLKTASSIETMSKQAAMSTTDFQEWTYALQQFNVSQEDAAAGMKMLAENAAQFVTQNSGPAKNAFGILGMSQADVQSAMKDESSFFALILQKLSEVKNSAEQIDLAKEIFGRSAGPELIEPIQAGIDALQEYREEAEKLGIVFSQDTIDAAKKAETELDNLHTILTDKLAIAIDQNADKLAHFAQVAIDNIPVVTKLMSGLAQAVEWAEDGVAAGYMQGYNDVQAGKGLFNSVLPPGINGFPTSPLVNPLSAFGQNSGDDSGGLHITVHPASNGSGDGSVPEIGDPEAAKEAERLAEANQKVIQSLQDEVDAMGQSDRQLAIVTAQRKLNKDATDDQRQAVADLAGQYYDEKQRMQEVKEASGDIVDALEDISLKGEKAGDVIKNLIIQLAELAEKDMFKTPTENGLTGLVNYIFGGSGSNVDTSAGQSVNVPGIGPLQSFAVGTDYVPYDMVAQIHKGEKITQTAQNNSSGPGVVVHNYAGVGVDVSQNGDQTEIRLTNLENGLARVDGSLETRALSAYQQAKLRSTTFGR